jgi:ABC-type multidrug transport system fused ATPase/permease subunit
MKLEPDEFERPGSTVSTAVRLALPALAFFALTPFAMAGLLVHYPAYRLTGFLAKRLARDADDIVSTIKIIASMLFFPLTWVIVSLGLYLISGWKAGLVALLLVPLFGFLAIRFFEELDQFIGGVRSLTFYLTRRRYFLRLLAERKAIFDEMLKMGEEPGQVGSAEV